MYDRSTLRAGITLITRIIWITILFMAAGASWYLFTLPDTSELARRNPKAWAIRTYREEQVRKLGKKPRSQWTWRGIDRISPHLRNAVVIAEDDTFFQHNGFDLAQIKRALKTNWERKRYAFGGSTLTQQLARSLYLSSHKNLLRKAKEALITRRLEATLTKERILELYLNIVEWGPQIHGAEAAARHYFNISAADLTPEEAIALAAILPSPRRWNPLSETPFMKQRKEILYDRMVRANYLPPRPTFDPVPWWEGEELFPDGVESVQPLPEEIEDVDPTLEDLPAGGADEYQTIVE